MGITPLNSSGGVVGTPVNKSYYMATAGWEQFTAAATSTSTAMPPPTLTPTSTNTSAPTATRMPISGNLIANGSFSRMAAAGDEPEGWYVVSWGVPYVSVSSAAAYDGDGLGLSLVSEGISYLLNQDVLVVPGTRYLLRG